MEYQIAMCAQIADGPLCACQSSMEADLTNNSLSRDSLAQQRSLERKMRNSLQLILPGGESEEVADSLIDGESYHEFARSAQQAKAMQR